MGMPALHFNQPSHGNFGQGDLAALLRVRKYENGDESEQNGDENSQNGDENDQNGIENGQNVNIGGSSRPPKTPPVRGHGRGRDRARGGGEPPPTLPFWSFSLPFWLFSLPFWQFSSPLWPFRPFSSPFCGRGRGCGGSRGGGRGCGRRGRWLLFIVNVH